MTTVNFGRILKKLRSKMISSSANIWLRVPSLESPQHIEPSLMVSLTSFPGRISTVWMTLESIYRQDLLPEKVVLVLSSEEFPDRQLPKSLRNYMSKGLEVIFHEGNIKSYKKLLPVLKKYPNLTIVTADDDVIYPRHWLGTLIYEHKRRPGYVLGFRGTVILSDGVNVEPYLNWPQANEFSDPRKVFLTGMGGILYPAGSLPMIVHDMELCSTLCPTADDIWFKAMTLIAKTPVAKVGSESGDFPVIRSAQKFSLKDINVKQYQNDTQFHATICYFDLMKEII